MSLRHGLLGLLNYEPKTGYDLDKQFKESLGHFWQAKGSQIYRELDAMEQHGWLASTQIKQDEKPNKRVYSITPAGKTEFMTWLSSPSGDIKNAMNIKSTFLMRVFFAGETSDKHTLEMLRLYRNASLQIKLSYDKEQSKYQQLTTLYSEIMNQAQIRWAEKSIALLEQTKDHPWWSNAAGLPVNDSGMWLRAI